MEEQKALTLTINGIVIEARASDSYVNATQMCQAGGKLFADWKKQESTKELINAMKSCEEYITSQKPLIESKKGRYGSGTWIHPDLAGQLAQWVDKIFAIRVSRWLRELMATGTVSVDANRSNDELKEMEQKWFESEKLRVAAEKKANYLHNYNKELLTYKKTHRAERDGLHRFDAKIRAAGHVQNRADQDGDQAKEFGAQY